LKGDIEFRRNKEEEEEEEEEEQEGVYAESLIALFNNGFFSACPSLGFLCGF